MAEPLFGLTAEEVLSRDDERGRPLGVVSSTDLLAATASGWARTKENIHEYP